MMSSTNNLRKHTCLVEIQLIKADWVIMAAAMAVVAAGLAMRFMGVGILIKGYLWFVQKIDSVAAVKIAAESEIDLVTCARR